MSKEYLENTDLRVEMMRSCKELLRSEKKTVRRLDGRFKGVDEFARGERPTSIPAWRPFVRRIRRRSTMTSAMSSATARASTTSLGGGIGPWD